MTVSLELITGRPQGGDEGDSRQVCCVLMTTKFVLETMDIVIRVLCGKHLRHCFHERCGVVGKVILLNERMLPAYHYEGRQSCDWFDDFFPVAGF